MLHSGDLLETEGNAEKESKKRIFIILALDGSPRGENSLAGIAGQNIFRIGTSAAS